MVEKSGVEGSGVEMSFKIIVRGHFNPRLGVEKFMHEKTGVEESGVGKFMVEKSEVERFGFETLR